MALQLPVGTLPVLRPVDSTLALSGAYGRITGFRFDLLDNDEQLIGVLNGVVPGGGIEHRTNAAIKGSGSMTVEDTGQDVDWLNVRLRPVALIEGIGEEVPMGIWFCAAPVESWTGLSRSWEVELIDKASVLDQDVYVDSAGNATSYAAPAGANVIDLVIALITETGESAAAIELDSAEVRSNLMWDVGTTRLRIINDLLEAANYYSLYLDLNGQFRATRYVPPAQRAIAFETEGLFTRGPASVMSPDWTKDRDIYDVPNRVVLVGQGDSEAEALTSTATNTDPANPFSQPARGRWVTMVDTGVEAVDQAALDALAYRRLMQAMSPATTFDITHLPVPGLLVNAIVRLTNPEAGVDSLCSVYSTSMPFSSFDLSATKLQEVVDL